MKRNTPSHPKMKALARALAMPLPYAVGTMELLWQWAGDFAKRGDVGKYTDEGIAEAVCWTGDPEHLIRMLVQEKWLDENEEHRLIVHDWPQHCEDSVHTHLARAGEYFADGSRPKLSKLTKDERVEKEETYAGKNVRRKAPKSAKKRPALPSLAKPQPSHSLLRKEGRKEGAASPPEPPASVSEFPETHAEVNQPPFAGTGAEVTAAIAKAARKVEPEATDASIALAVRVTRWPKQHSPWAWVKKVPEYLRSTPPDLRGKPRPTLVPARAAPSRDDLRRMGEAMMLAKYAAEDKAASGD